MSELEAAWLHVVAQPVLDGHRRVDALWFPHDWLDEPARQRLLLVAWRPGSRAHRFADGDLLCFAQAVWADCEASQGWPLQRVAGTLCSAAIEAVDLAGRPFADAWLALGGALRPLRLSDAQALDPSQWLASSEVFVKTFDLRLREPERTLVAPTARDLRKVLGPAVPEAASEDTQHFLQALKQRAAASSQAPTASRAARALQATASIGFGRIGLVLAIASALLVLLLLWSSDSSDSGSHGFGVLPIVLFVWLWRVLAPGSTQAPGRARGRPTPAKVVRAGGGGWAAAIRARFQKRTPQRWRDWAARLSMNTGLHRLLGAQQAAYMRRVLSMFDEGRIEDALRHAVPLGGDGEESLGQAFGRLGPRQDLSLQGQRAASSTYNFGVSFEQHLRALYRRTFEKLDAAGRIDEATFVLAELLRARQEALDYLEKHGRFEQAAELAFGWDMPAAQIVRLQALAGQWRQAVLVARRDNVFAEAITLLEKRWPEAGARLRREWAETLVAQGRWLDAVLAIWPLADERSRAGEWLAIVETAGGTLAARSLALRAQCQPETLASRAEFIVALRDDPALAAERAALVNELLRAKAPVEPALRRLATLIVGMTIADQAGEQASLDAKTLQSLASLAGDAALSADLPQAGQAWQRMAPQPLAKRESLAEWEAPPAGSLPIFDAVPLADGEFLVALGEAGAARLDARGRRLAHFNQPAHRLVISTDGRSALALAPRERVWRVTRLELVSGASGDLGMHAFDTFADQFDGIGWTVGSGTRVQVLDTTTGLREALWQVADLPGSVVAIDTTQETELLILRCDETDPPHLQQWSYALPSRRLRSRDVVPQQGPDADGVETRRILVRGFGLVDLSFGMDDSGAVRVKPALAHEQRWANLPALGPDPLMFGSDGWLAVRSDTHPSIRLIEFASGRVRGCWHWPAAVSVGLRCVGRVWLVFDREGRLSTVNLETGTHRAIAVR